jgi:tyrosine-protein phosphatase YwqE
MESLIVTKEITKIQHFIEFLRQNIIECKYVTSENLSSHKIFFNVPQSVGEIQTIEDTIDLYNPSAIYLTSETIIKENTNRNILSVGDNYYFLCDFYIGDFPEYKIFNKLVLLSGTNIKGQTVNLKIQRGQEVHIYTSVTVDYSNTIVFNNLEILGDDDGSLDIQISLKVTNNIIIINSSFHVFLKL